MANNRPTIVVYPKRGMCIEWHNAEIAYADSKEIIVRTNDDNLLHTYTTDKVSYIQKI